MIGFKVSEDQNACTKLLCVVGGLLPYLAAGRQTGQGNEGKRGMTGRRDGDRRVGSSDRGSQPMVGEMSEERHGKARICARNLAGNNKGQQPAGSTIFLAGTQNDGGTQPCFPSLPLLWE